MLKKIPKEVNVWVTSDTHYNHKNLCRGVTEWRTTDGLIPVNDTRDFTDLITMNKTIVDNINGVVGCDDFLIHLGDWSFGGFDNIMEFRKQLVCNNIYLTIGNHDHHIKNNKENIRNIFSEVGDLLYDISYLKHRFFFSHYPLFSWKDMRGGTIHLHGHSHLEGEKRYGIGKRMDVGIDGHPEFRPYNIRDEILPYMNKIDIGSELDDHHNRIDRM